MKAAGSQSIALLGDVMMTRSVSVYDEPEYLEMRRILNEADVVFANFESAAHPYLDDPHQQRNEGGSYVTTEPKLLANLKWLGVDMVSSGSGHADDYGIKGLLETLTYLDEAGITHAGSGRHLGEARAPAFLDTSTGRVALLAATSQFRGSARAGDQRYDTLGHPGVNGFRFKTIYEVDPQTFAEVTSLGEKLGLRAEQLRREDQGHDDAVSKDESYEIFGKHFKLGSHVVMKTEANPSDRRMNLQQVGYARKMADRVVVSFHGHELGGPTLPTAKKRSEIDDIADFIRDYGRACLDAGADIFVTHGPQSPMAVELYKGKAFFHGIGAFIFQIETMKYLPSEAYERYGLGDRATPADFIEARYKGDTRGHAGNAHQWEQMFCVCDFRDHRLRQIRIYPIDLGHARSRSQRGRPIPATGDIAARVLARVQRLSARYGTRVDIRGDVGFVDVE
jgi:poly-gamma-glutamate capsule biosynthesis protein CapA/YwtB (metallophosphatase superfamily)